MNAEVQDAYRDWLNPPSKPKELTSVEEKFRQQQYCQHDWELCFPYPCRKCGMSRDIWFLRQKSTGQVRKFTF